MSARDFGGGFLMPTPDICCSFDSPVGVGDAAAVIIIRSGSPDAVSGLTIYAEGCECHFSDDYSDSYCDPTEGGAFPSAAITDTEYTIDEIPANSILTIDAAERRVTLTDNAERVQSSDIDALDWSGLFEWIEATKGGCQSICIDVLGAVTNADTTVEINVYEREL